MVIKFQTVGNPTNGFLRSFFAPHLLFPQFLYEDSLKKRADGIAMGLELLLECLQRKGIEKHPDRQDVF